MSQFPRAGFLACLDAAYSVVERFLDYRRADARQLLPAYERDDPEKLSALDAQLAIERISLLRRALRRVPYWGRGHLALGELSLAIDDIATAYASSQAVARLALNRSRFAVRGRRLLGRCFLRRGEIDHAVAVFSAILNGSPDDSESKEELAACHLALGEPSRAYELLRSIPEAELTMPGRAALAHSRPKSET